MSKTTLNTPLRDRYDLLIVGGGICGAAAAYEASRRGLSALLVERSDYGEGASSNSMKIVHGGLRYLQDYDIRRVLRSHRELRILMKIAPHLVRPLHSELVMGGRGRLFKLKFRAGLMFYSRLAGLTDRFVHGAPRVAGSRYPYWYDGIVTDTEQLLLDFLHTAILLGSGKVSVRNYTSVDGYVHDRGQVVGARIPTLGEIKVSRVLECTGTRRRDLPVRLAMNLVVDPLTITASRNAVGLVHPGDGRYVFVVPWRDRCMVGTYERAYPFDPCEPLRIEEGWIDEFLAWLAPAHPELSNLSREGIRFVHAGLLPKEDHATSRLLKTDRIAETSDGRIQVLGVKYTTARVLASEAVELAAGGLRAQRDRGGSRGGLPTLMDRRSAVEAYMDHDPHMQAPLLAGRPDLKRGDVLFAVDREQARTLGDVLLRRTGWASAGHPGGDVVGAVATALEERLGWPDGEKVRQIESFDNDYRFGRSLSRG